MKEFKSKAIDMTIIEVLVKNDFTTKEEFKYEADEIFNEIKMLELKGILELDDEEFEKYVGKE